MLKLAARLSRGHLRQHRLEALLCLLGIALGVSVVVGIDLAVQACIDSFQGAVRTLADRATHSITHPRGYLTDEEYIQFANAHPAGKLAPVIDRRVVVNDASGKGVLVRLIGVDVFAERTMRSATRVDTSLGKSAYEAFLTRPGNVVIVDALAERLGNVRPQQQLQLIAGSARRTITVAGVITLAGPGRSQLPDLMIADLATAQELLDSIGRLDRVDVVLESDAAVTAMRSSLPPSFILNSTDERAAALTELIGAYRLNLNALSLMASFVAVFIVYNSLLVSVKRRANSLAILRCLGSSRPQMGAIYAVEALAFAAAGAAIGILAGWALSLGLVQLVGNTINDLYAAVRPHGVPLSLPIVLKGVAVSFASALLGAIVPLWQATQAPPISVLRSSDDAARSRKAAPYFAAAGLLLLALTPAIYYLPGQSPVAGFVMALTTALGFACLCPLLTRWGCALANAVARRHQSLPMQSAAGGVSRSLGITGVAVAAMMLAMAMSIGIQTMVGSFRNTLGSWLDQRFRYDLFIAPQLAIDHRIESPLPTDIEPWVAQQPQVERYITYRSADTLVADRPVQLVSTEVADLLAANSLPLKQSLGAQRPFDPTHDLLASEPMAARAKFRVGDTITLASPAGPMSFTLYGIYRDFGSERGQVMIDRATYRAAWRDEQISSIHAKLRPGFDPESVAALWGPTIESKEPVLVHSFAHVKGETQRIFDRTFRVTKVLGWLAGGVAFCGLAGALVALSLARTREYGVLSALGMSGRQLAASIMTEGLIIAITAGLVAMAAGTALAYVLADVIQYRSFGWSIPTGPRPRYWLQSLATAIVAALAATIYPVLKLRKQPPAISLRQE